MYKRRVFSMDPQYFPLNRMQEIVSYLHNHEQHYGVYLFHDVCYREELILLAVMMVDPAVAYQPDDPAYMPYHRGKEADVWLKHANGSDLLGVVWPGVTVYPGASCFLCKARAHR
jgi:alpha-glucosidase